LPSGLGAAAGDDGGRDVTGFAAGWLVEDFGVLGLPSPPAMPITAAPSTNAAAPMAMILPQW
jgi:hypothetical protein